MTKLQELINKLNQLFELDKTDLDFGIYRLINQRQDKIKYFITNKLPDRVANILGSANTQDLEDAYKKAKEECIASFGKEAFDSEDNLSDMFAQTPAGKRFLEAKDKFQNKSLSSQLETEVYSHLLDFFSRYYQDGDFISQRRSAIKDKYAIPYNGEEVIMHWANKDQYYIKSSETLKDYVFMIGDKKVKFKLAGSDAVKDNNQAKRQMLLFKELEGAYDEADGRVNIQVNDKELIIPFYFKEVSKALTEKQLIEALEKNLEKILQDDWKELLKEDDPTYTGDKNRSILGKHLQAYVRKQTSDFFIHKDLAGFLKRELDFYIKNEVMYLDDVVDKEPDYLTSEIRKIKAIRTIAQELIEFLAQIENFQKKLWLKKKFIYQTNYCITLDRIPQDFYPQIADNQEQIAEWKKLFAIEEIKTDAIHTSYEDFEKGNTENKLKFLTDNKYLVLDTSFFSQDFKYKLLSTIDNLDENTDGLLIHSENFQALNLLQERYKEKVKCIYIDPPYNTGNDGFSYKDQFQHSSWCTMIMDRLKMSIMMFNHNGLFVCHMDENEHLSLEWIVKNLFGENGDLGKLVWDKRNPKGDSKGIATQHEYVHFATPNPEHLKSVEGAFVRIKINAETILNKALKLIKRAGGINDNARILFKNWLKKQDFTGGEKAYSNIDDDGNVYRPVSMAWPNKKKAPDEYFEPLIHPLTNKQCPVPARGWRNPPETMKSLIDADLIIFGNDETTIPNRKYFLKDNLIENVSSLYYMGGSDDALFSDMNFTFENPKPINAAKYFLSISARPQKSTILDYFAGSGTTGHAVINLNREDGGTRKYILVEMGNYFDTVTKPRIEKVVYSTDWKSGKPVTRDTGISHCFKYIRMESYEDTLNNLTLQDQSPDLFGIDSESVNQDYLINYMLDIESKASLMDIDRFDSPFDYQIKIHNYESGQAELKQVDLIETFNYLLGVEVVELKVIDGFVKIEGINPANERILIIWRNVDVHDNKALNDFLTKVRVNPAETEYRAIYVNGDHTIEDPHKKIFNIAQVFNELMFECEDV